MPPKKKQSGGLVEKNTNVIATESGGAKKEVKKTGGKNITTRKGKQTDADKENKSQPSHETEKSTSDQLFITQPNLRDDIQSFQALLNKLNNSLNSVSKDEIIQIGNQLMGLTGWNTIEVTQQDQIACEGILSMIGSLLEKDVEAASQREQPQLIAHSKTFCRAVLALIKQYPSSVVDPNQHCLFQTHYGYELSLYILLSLVEKTAIASIFIENFSSSEIMELLKSLSQAIPRDVFYLTQEMAVEAICRICFFLTSNKKDILLTLEKSSDDSWEKELKSIILSGKASIIKLLKDMRPYLTAINKANPNIQSYSLLQINESNCGSNSANKKGISQSSIWLDVCQSFLCVYIGELDIFVRLKYDQLSILAATQAIIKLGVKSGLLPPRLEEVIQIPIVKKSDDDTDTIQELQLRFQSMQDAVSARSHIYKRISGEKEIPQEGLIVERSEEDEVTKEELSQHKEDTAAIKESVVFETMIQQMTICEMQQRGTQEEQQNHPVRYGIATTKPINFDTVTTRKKKPSQEYTSPPMELEQFHHEDTFEVGVEPGEEADVEMIAEIHAQQDIPPYIPSVVSITATENNISDLSEENEEDSYDRQQVRESKRLSASKVDSLTALFAHTEPPRTAKKFGEEFKSKTKQTPTAATPHRSVSNQRGRRATKPATAAESARARSASPFLPSEKTPTPRMRLSTTPSRYGDAGYYQEEDVMNWHDDIGSYPGDQQQSVSIAKDSTGTSSKGKFGKKTNVQTTLHNPLSPASVDEKQQSFPQHNLDFSEKLEVSQTALEDDDEELLPSPDLIETLKPKTTPAIAPTKQPTGPSTKFTIKQQEKAKVKSDILASWDNKLDNESSGTSKSKRKFGRKDGTGSALKSTILGVSAPEVTSKASGEAKEKLRKTQPPKRTGKVAASETKPTSGLPSETKTEVKPKPQMSMATVEQKPTGDKSGSLMKPLALAKTSIESGKSKNKSEVERKQQSHYDFSREGQVHQIRGMERPPATPQPEEYPISHGTDMIGEENVSWERELIEVEKSIKVSPPQEKSVTGPSAAIEPSSKTKPIGYNIEKEIIEEEEEEEEEDQSTLAESRAAKEEIKATRKSPKRSKPEVPVTTQQLSLLEMTTTSTSVERLTTVKESAKEEESIVDKESEEEHYTPADVTDFETTTHVHIHADAEQPKKGASAKKTITSTSARKHAHYTEQHPSIERVDAKRQRRKYVEDASLEEVDSFEVSAGEESDESYDYHSPSKKPTTRRREVDTRTAVYDSGSGSNEDESVYTMLINEIVALNKQRAARRKSRIIDGMYNNVLEQLTTFIQNSFNNLSTAWKENEDQNVVSKLNEQILPIMTQIADTLKEYEEKRSTKEEQLATAIQQFTQEYSEFESLANTYINDREKEMQSVQQELSRKRKSYQEHCSREVKSIFQTSSNKLPRIGAAKDVAHLLR